MAKEAAKEAAKEVAKEEAAGDSVRPTQLLSPPCPTVHTTAQFAVRPSGSKAQGKAGGMDSERLTTHAVCGGPPPRLALCLGGLARTLSHPLVYTSLRGHVIDGKPQLTP